MPELTAPHTQHCLVSAQAVPNVLPLLDPAVRPQRAVLWTTPEMASRAQTMQAVMNEFMAVEIRALADGFHIPTLVRQFTQSLEAEPGTAWLNATGGTKLMSLAAVMAFQSAGHPIFYVRHDTDQLIWVSHPDQPQPHSLTQSLDIRRFLQLHGYAVPDMDTGMAPPGFEFSLSRHLLEQMVAKPHLLAVLNAMALKAANQKGFVPWRDRRNCRDFTPILRPFKEIGWLRLDDQGMHTVNTEVCMFLAGGWLEQLVKLTAVNLRAQTHLQLTDVRANVEVISAKQVRNELDVVMLAHNTLFIIECKASKFIAQGGAAKAGDASAALYKLDALKDLVGGLRAQAMLVSVAPVRASDHQRARDLRNIQIVQGEEILHLKDRLIQWIRP